jgi:hypothetical protein
VAGLTAQRGTEAGNEGESLAQFAVGYVLLPAPVDPGLARLLDGVVGLRPVSQTSSFALWRVSVPAGRVRVVEPGGAQVDLASGTVSVNGAAAPAAGGTLVLAEPESGSWHAALNGRPLTPLPSPVYGWAQGFRLPAGGGRIDITRNQTARAVVVTLEAVLLVTVAVLALPGAMDSTPDAGEAGAESRTRRAGHPAAGSGRGARGRDRGAGGRRGTHGAPSRGRRRPGADGADAANGTGPRPVPAGAGWPPARTASMPRDLPPDLSASRDGGVAQDSLAPRLAPQDEAAEPGWGPGDPAGRVQETDWGGSWQPAGSPCSGWSCSRSSPSRG